MKCTELIQLLARDDMHAALLRQISLPHEVAVTFTGGAPSFIEGPNNQALAAAAVPCGKDARDTGRIGAGQRFHVGTLVTLDTQLLEQRVFRTEKTHGKQRELAGHNLFRARDLLGHEPSLLILLPFNLDDFHFLQVAVLVAKEASRGQAIDTRIIPENRFGLFLAVIQLINLLPLGPRVVCGALERRLRQNLKLDEALATVTHRGANTVSARVPAADDHDILALGGDEVTIAMAT